MRNLQVIRNKPRDRDKFTNLSGILNVTVKTVSYLHIGSGVEQIKISEKITSIAGDINRGLKELAQSRWKDIVGEGEYVAMPSVKNHPVIPGSSIKGNVRARIELSFVPRNDSVRSCFSVDMWNTPKNAWRHA
ncbi:MAG: RAMP superfamily CRISPR-associated protein, partial [Candidatus Caldarchaeum sp.]